FLGGQALVVEVFLGHDLAPPRPQPPAQRERARPRRRMVLPGDDAHAVDGRIEGLGGSHGTPGAYPIPARAQTGYGDAMPMDADQQELFADRSAPLAERMRPRTLDEIVGQDHLLGKDQLLRRAI